MRNINKSVAIIIPKKPFANWANHLPGVDTELSFNELKKYAKAILLEKFTTSKEAKEVFSQTWNEVFEEYLTSWSNDVDYWPTGRTKELFYKWFDVEFYSNVLDL